MRIHFSWIKFQEIYKLILDLEFFVQFLFPWNLLSAEMASCVNVSVKVIVACLEVKFLVFRQCLELSEGFEFHNQANLIANTFYATVFM